MEPDHCNRFIMSQVADKQEKLGLLCWALGVAASVGKFLLTSDIFRLSDIGYQALMSGTAVQLAAFGRQVTPPIFYDSWILGYRRNDCLATLDSLAH